MNYNIQQEPPGRTTATATAYDKPTRKGPVATGPFQGPLLSSIPSPSPFPSPSANSTFLESDSTTGGSLSSGCLTNIPPAIFASKDVRLKKEVQNNILPTPPGFNLPVGLIGQDSQWQGTTLTSLLIPRTKTARRRNEKHQEYDPSSDIFKKHIITNNQLHHIRTNQEKQLSEKPKKLNIPKFNLPDKVKRLMLKSSLNSSSVEKKCKLKSEAIEKRLVVTSLDRKVQCSEQQCPRKSLSNFIRNSVYQPCSSLLQGHNLQKSFQTPDNAKDTQMDETLLSRSGWTQTFVLKGGLPNTNCFEFVNTDEEILEYKPILKRAKLERYLFIKVVLDECISEVVDSCEKKRNLLNDKDLENIFRNVFENVKDIDDLVEDNESSTTTVSDQNSESHIFAKVLHQIGSEEMSFCEMENSDYNSGQDKDLESIFGKVLKNISPIKNTNKSTTVDTVMRGAVEICSANCPNKQCFKLEAVVLDAAKSILSNHRKSKLHNFLLQRIHLQDELGIDTSSTFAIGKHNFCHSALQYIFGISKYMISTVISEFRSGVTQKVHGNKGNKYNVSKTDICIAWIRHFSEVHSENLPDRLCLQLPSYLNIISLYTIYSEQTAEDNRVKVREFYTIFQKNFHDTKRECSFLPRVIFLCANTHPVCNECALISNMRKMVKTESDQIYAESRKRLHMLDVRRKYLGLRNRMELSVRYPGDYLHVNLDDIDQKKIESPYSRQNTKEFQGMLRLNNHVTGVIITNGNLECDKTYQLYLNNDQFCQDSNKTISIMFDVLKYVQMKLGFLPKKLHVQSDNCGKDLKNQFVLSFYYTLVEMDVFDEVLISHMPVGHTHGDVDQFFSIIADRLKKLEIPTFESLVKELEKIKVNGSGGFPMVKEMKSTTDFVAWLEPCLLKISGHSDFFQFKIRKAQNKTNMFVKESELDEDFKYPRGIKLFNYLPDNFEMKTSPFRAESDYGSIFESVWNKYIPSLKFKYSEDEVTKFKREWENRINFLISLRTENFEPFDLRVLRKQQVEPNVSSLQHLDNQPKVVNPASITAVFHPLEMDEFQLKDLKENLSLVFYCDIKSNRPWIGLMVELEGENQVKVQWLKKERKVFKLHWLESGQPYTSVLDLNSIMFSDVLINISATSNRSGPYKMDDDIRVSIMKAYDDHDQL